MGQRIETYLNRRKTEKKKRFCLLLEQNILHNPETNGQGLESHVIMYLSYQFLICIGSNFNGYNYK